MCLFNNKSNLKNAGHFRKKILQLNLRLLSFKDKFQIFSEIMVDKTIISYGKIKEYLKKNY